MDIIELMKLLGVSRAQYNGHEISVEQVFEWTGPDGKLQKFLVSNAQRIIRESKHQIHSLAYEDVVRALELNFDPSIDPVAMENADLENPVIIATLDDGHNVIIDGWHRIAKCVKLEHKAGLLAYVLSVEETNKCRV